MSESDEKGFKKHGGNNLPEQSHISNNKSFSPYEHLQIKGFEHKCERNCVCLS